MTRFRHAPEGFARHDFATSRATPLPNIDNIPIRTDLYKVKKTQFVIDRGLSRCTQRIAEAIARFFLNPLNVLLVEY